MRPPGTHMPGTSVAIIKLTTALTATKTSHLQGMLSSQGTIVARTARVLAANPIPKARLARLVRVHCSAVRLGRCYLYHSRYYLCIDGTCALQKVGTLP